MKDAKDVIPWKVTDISLRPYDGFWSFNPSIHFDGERWLCGLRCCDYAMPNGVTVRSPKARPGGHQTKNAMVIFDPASWQPIKIYKMAERDDLPRAACPTVGYEDMRIFKTDKGGLQGIAASLHLKREKGSQNQPPEQVLLSFDGEYNIVAAKPIRGDWSGTAQKNWVPFDHAAEPRFLYSIGRGSMFDDRGRLSGDAAIARPSVTTRPVSAVVDPPPFSEEGLRNENEERARFEREEQERIAREEHERREKEEHERQEREAHERREREKRFPHVRHPDLRTKIRGGDVQVVRGKRMALDASSTRPSSVRHGTTRSGDQSTRMASTGRVLLPRYEGLRGGTQLSRVGDDSWLGIGHEMKFVSGKKFYWHVFYLVDSRGKMTAASEPMKFVANGIEFAAGMAIDGDRVVVSFGVDDMECRLGETRLSAVLAVLRPVER